MPKYRKKPIEIDAMQWIKGKTDPFLIFMMSDDIDDMCMIDGELMIHTLEGLMKVSDGDYVIKGIKGEIYPCKPDIFEQTYEKVE